MITVSSFVLVALFSSSAETTWCVYWHTSVVEHARGRDINISTYLTCIIFHFAQYETLRSW